MESVGQDSGDAVDGHRIEGREVASNNSLVVRLHSHRANDVVSTRGWIKTRSAVTDVVRVPFTVQSAGRLFIVQDGDKSPGVSTNGRIDATEALEDH